MDNQEVGGVPREVGVRSEVTLSNYPESGGGGGGRGGRMGSQEEVMRGQYNMKSPTVKRLMKEVMELRENDEPDILHATPLEDNLFEWHYTFKGPPDSVFGEGIYHGRLIFGSEYPHKPPEIVMLTPNGRFEVGTKICLSISNYHPETWLPVWGVRTAITALRSFMAVDNPGAIGALDCSAQVRTQMALKSKEYVCPCCGSVADLLAKTAQQQEDGNDADSEADAPRLELVEIPRAEVESETSDDDENEPLPSESFTAWEWTFVFIISIMACIILRRIYFMLPRYLGNA